MPIFLEDAGVLKLNSYWSPVQSQKSFRKLLVGTGTLNEGFPKGTDVDSFSQISYLSFQQLSDSIKVGAKGFRKFFSCCTSDFH
jgi:hypothetical protein